MQLEEAFSQHTLTETSAPSTVKMKSAVILLFLAFIGVYALSHSLSLSLSLSLWWVLTVGKNLLQ